MLFEHIWKNIRRSSGHPFNQVSGKTFAYQAHEGFLKPSTTNRNIPKSDFERAHAAQPLKNVRQVRDLGVQGPSYVFAILTDKRVSGDISSSLPLSAPVQPLPLSGETDDRAPGDSAEQRLAESYLVTELERQLGTPLSKQRLPLSSGEHLEVDGFSKSPPVLCEAWAHIGSPKSAQKNKVMADAFKLLYVSGHFFKSARKILVFGDTAAAAHFVGRSWMAQALKWGGVEVLTIELPPDLRAAVLSAQKRQFR